MSKKACQPTSQWSCYLLAVFLSLFGLLSSVFSSPILASTYTFDTQDEWRSGQLNNTSYYAQSGAIELSEEGSWSAAAIKNTHYNLYEGAVAETDGHYVYVLTQYTNFFSRYVPEENDWEILQSTPFTPSLGASTTYLDGYIYAVFGGYMTKFARYNVSLDEWETLADIPEYIYRGGAMATDGTDIYLLRGTNNTEFWKYSLATGEWSSMPGYPATVNGGSSLTYQDGYFYALRGNSQKNFYRFSMENNQWEVLNQPAQVMVTDRDVALVGNDIYVPRGNGTTDVYKYNITTGQWSSTTSAPYPTRYVGMVYVADEEMIYFFNGNGTNRAGNSYIYAGQLVWKFDPDSDSYYNFQLMADDPDNGGDFFYYDGALYSLLGDNQNSLFKYTESTNTWSTMATAPAVTAEYDIKGTLVERAGTHRFYVQRGAGSSSPGYFSYYNLDNNTWTTLPDYTTYFSNGASSAYPGGDYLYLTMGNTRRNFIRYDLVNNTWDDAIVADLPVGFEVSIGSRMFSDGTDVYVLTSGDGEAKLLRYDISEDEWIEEGLLPAVPYYGSDVTVYNNKVYYQVGNYRLEVWVYDLTAKTWSRLRDLQGENPYNYGPYDGGSLEVSSTGRLYSSFGRNSGYMQMYEIGGGLHSNSGSWLSPVLNLAYVSSFGNLDLSQTTPGDTAIAAYTRTSSNGTTWDNWQLVTEGTINSAAKPYLQVRLDLTASSDQTLSPSIDSLTINYVGDAEPPTDPSNFSAYSQRVGGMAISSGQISAQAHPYFTWDAATDAETTAAGYYIYFGNNPAGDPEDDGVLRLAPSFEVLDSLVNDTYYLRVQAVDQAGNKSAIVDAFTFVYQGPEETSLQFWDSADFALGSFETTAVENASISLEHSGGFWLEETIDYGPASIAMGDSASVLYDATENAIFVLEGNNGVDFAKYDFDEQAWTDLSDLPGGARYGSFLAQGPAGYIYAARGNSTSDFYRYEISSNTWTNSGVAVTPSYIYRGRGTGDGERYIYALRGNDSDSFWRYDTSANVWNNLENATFEVRNNVNYGSYLEYDGNDSLYVIQGGVSAGFSKYNVNTDTWTMLPTLPHLATVGAFIKYYEDDNYLIYYPGGYRFMYKFDISSNEWSQLSDPPILMSAGSDAVIVGDDMYFFRGTGSYVYIYNLTTDTWRYPHQGLFADVFNGTNYVIGYNGADMVKGDGDLLYMTWGNWSSDFISYNPNSGETVHLADLPAGAYTGTDLAYDEDDNKIYAAIGSSSYGFFAYDIATDSWNQFASDDLPYLPTYGSSLAYDGERYVYWMRGGNSNYFYRFDKDGIDGSRWERLANNIPGGVYYGAELVKKGDYLYTLRGNTYNPDPLYRFDLNNLTWSTMASFPNVAGYDAFLLDNYNPDELFACSANNNTTRACYTYSIANNEWTDIGKSPARINHGAAGASDGAGKIYMMAGNGTGYLRDALYTYIEETEQTAYVNYGEYVSPSHDLGSVYDFAQLQVEIEEPANTSVKIFSRTSSDAENWSGWASVSSKNEDDNYAYYKINSPSAQYLQVKFDLSSVDNIYSPRILGYEVQYYRDLLAPSNPMTAGLEVFDAAAQSVALTSETWYPYSAPYFDWPDEDESNGASDGLTGSGVYGYYVYFGTETDAIPEEDGAFRMSSYYQPIAGSLTSGETYYLRLQTIDNAGNLSEEIWQPFVYYFDNAAADYPENLISDPSGYSVSDSYTFSWNAIVPDDGDLISYCYKLQNQSTEETCTLETSVTGIAPYQSGTNVFLLRSKDRAGNYSAYTTVNYYHSGAAPSPPQNLQVSPASATTNEFTFSWSQPEFFYGSAEGLRYYYSVNALPTSSSVTQTTSQTTLFAGPYATLPGENTLYMVTKDEAGKIDYNLYTSVKFEANTTAPGIPVNVDIADVSVKATANWRLALSWEEPTEVGAGIASYKVLRSTDGANFSEIVRTSGTSHVDTRLIQQDYYYKVQACDSTNNCGVASSIVTLFPDGKYVEPANLLAEPSTSMITSKMATISWATDRTCDSKIAYGKSSGSYNDLEAYNSMHVTDHTLTLVDLEPGTTYYYVAKWTDEDGNTGISEEASFATDPPPTVMEVVVENVSINSATLNFTTVGASAVAIYYGTDTTFGGLEAMATSTTESSYTLLLEGLSDDTLYYYKINALDADGNQYEGTILDFKTLPAPKLAEVTVQQIRGTAQPTVLVSWQSNTQVSSIVTYYPTATPALASDEINVELKSGLHRMLLKNLQANMPYSLIVKGIDKVGNEAVSEVLNFTTDSDNRPPAITDVKVDGSINNAIGSDEVTAQLVVTWNTDEMSSSQVEFGEGTGSVYAQKTQLDSNKTFNHTVLVSGLTPSKVYHLRVLSMDEAGNEGKSVDIVKVTPKASDSALDLVVNNLSQVFGFLGQR